MYDMDDNLAVLKRRFWRMFDRHWPLPHMYRTAELSSLFDELERVLWFNIVENLEETHDGLFARSGAIAAAIVR